MEVKDLKKGELYVCEREGCKVSCVFRFEKVEGESIEGTFYDCPSRDNMSGWLRNKTIDPKNIFYGDGKPIIHNDSCKSISLGKVRKLTKEEERWLTIHLI